MESILLTKLEFPLIEIVLLLSLSTVCVLWQRIKLALLINYLFVLYWGYIFNRDLLFNKLGDAAGFCISLYFGFGLMVVGFSLIGFIHSEN